MVTFNKSFPVLIIIKMYVTVKLKTLNVKFIETHVGREDELRTKHLSQKEQTLSLIVVCCRCPNITQGFG
jgi:hypothetical protein